ncbi:ATP-binding protein [uncultured Sphingomonas sp.]|uniref:sensor histidine kinase n=1 Tax=uncultured Sphingomonas sp. TaxID=158754 RepID=UPI0025FDB8D3|nr:ATP-binding protein [uncultured Sphingomonas sp.]
MPSRSRSLPGRLVGPLVITIVIVIALALAGNRWANLRANSMTEDAAMTTARTHAELLSSELQKFRLLPLVLGDLPEVRDALTGSQQGRQRLNERLELLSARTAAATIYVIDARGVTVSASNYRLPTSLVGLNYNFRPYFQDAVRSGSAEIFAMGTVSRRPGLYLSRRISENGRTLGVIVLKVEFNAVEGTWAGSPGISYVVDNQNIVLITSRPDWRFRSIGPVDPQVATKARRTLQFGDAPPRPAPITMQGDVATDASGARYRVGSVPAPIANARLIHLTPIAPALTAAYTLAMLWGVAGLLVAVLVTAIVFRDVERRRLAHRARIALEREVSARTAELRETNERLRIESDERVAVDRRYRDAREELAQANRLGTLGQITAGVAHEINQPVAAIRTFAENGATLLDRGAADAARENLTRIVGLADRIGSITAELRGFARKKTPTGGVATLGDILDGLLILIGERARGRVAIVADPAGRATRLIGDRVRIEQILVNLIQNALDAIGDGDGRITITATRADDQLTIVVADTGPGVASNIRGALFTPFTSGKPAGLGLGLAIARDIAREFGGELALRDEGPGAQFALRLKVAA